MKSVYVWMFVMVGLSLAALAQNQSAPDTMVVPRLLRLSGQLKDAKGTAGITFTLHKSQSDNVPLWMETQTVKLDADGKYTVLLGSTKTDGVPMELFTSGEAQWLGIHVDGKPEQRILLVSVPYALKAAEAETLAGHSVNEFVTADKVSNLVQQQMQQQATPQRATSKKDAGAKGNGVNSGATNFTDTTSNQVVLVTQNGTGYALVATAVSGSAIAGTAAAAAGSVAGVKGTSASPSGYGVFGQNTAATGAAVGIRGTTTSTSGVGLYGSASSPTGSTTGVRATVASTNGTAAMLFNTAGGKILSGRSGAANTEVFSVDGSGNIAGTGSIRLMTNGLAAIFGDIGCGSGISGISFATPSNCATAALYVDGPNTVINTNGGSIMFQHGDASFGYLGSTGGLQIYAPSSPVDGVSATGGANYSSGGTGANGGSFFGSYGTYGGKGVYAVGGENGGQGVYARGGFSADGLYAEPGSFGTYAGNFKGDLNVTGKIYAGSKDFKIDHPTDPANKYLYHASVESSEMVNVYSGNVTTDASGNAVVTLPDWFEAVNGDFRYQLTPIGQFAQAIVGKKIENHRFTIRTDKPNVEVSWQVTGVRHDAFALANPLVVEQAKPEIERGYYIHPELYGAPAEKQVERAHGPAPVATKAEAARLQRR